MAESTANTSFKSSHLYDLSLGLNNSGKMIDRKSLITAETMAETSLNCYDLNYKFILQVLVIYFDLNLQRCKLLTVVVFAS
jgi:hypothetical protein